MLQANGFIDVRRINHPILHHVALGRLRFEKLGAVDNHPGREVATNTLTNCLRPGGLVAGTASGSFEVFATPGDAETATRARAAGLGGDFHPEKQPNSVVSVAPEPLSRQLLGAGGSGSNSILQSVQLSDSLLDHSAKACDLVGGITGGTEGVADLLC